jgi:hypothetical protein
VRKRFQSSIGGTAQTAATSTPSVPRTANPVRRACLAAAGACGHGAAAGVGMAALLGMLDRRREPEWSLSILSPSRGTC